MKLTKVILRQDGKVRPWVWLAIFASTLLFVWVTPYVVSVWSGKGSASSAGEFADQFGLANAVFSGLALAAVAITLYLQTKELEEQRKENDDTQEILENQQLQLAAQSELLRNQLFQSNFYSQLELLVSTRLTGTDYEKICNARWREINSKFVDLAAYFLNGLSNDLYIKNPNKKTEYQNYLPLIDIWKERIDFSAIMRTDPSYMTKVHGLPPIAVRAAMMWAYRIQEAAVAESLGPQLSIAQSIIQDVANYYNLNGTSEKSSIDFGLAHDASRKITMLGATLLNAEIRILSCYLDQDQNRYLQPIAVRHGLYRTFVPVSESEYHITNVECMQFETPSMRSLFL